MAILRSITTVGGYTAGSRMLGYFRDLLTAHFLGAGPITDAVVVAIKLPSLFRRLLAEGAFNAAFVPIFTDLYTREGSDSARTFAEEILSLFTFALIGIVLLVEVFLPWLMHIFAPGFKSNPEQFALAVYFTRITFPFLIFISLTALFSGVLNSLEKFAAAASSPMVGNLAIILVFGGFTPLFGMGGDFLATAILVCGVVQLLWVMVPAQRGAVRLQLKRPRMTGNVHKFLLRMAPVAVGSGVYQFNVFIGTAIASTLQSGSISVLYYAERLNQLPLSIIGTAMGTVLLPLLSRQMRENSPEDANKTQNQGIELALLMTLPAMMGLICLSHPIIKVLFERGQFGAYETLITAQALAMFATGLPAYVLIKILITNFYARQDMTRPLIAGAVGVGVDITLSLALKDVYGHVGIAIATSAAAWVNALWLATQLWRQKAFVLDRRLLLFLPRIGLATLGAALGLELSKPFILITATSVNGSLLMPLMLLIVMGLLLYLTLGKLLRAFNWGDLKQQFSAQPA